MKTTLTLACVAASLVACAATAPAPPTKTAGPAPDQPTSTASTVATGSKCTIGGTAFNAAFAKREDDEDDNAVRVFIFSAAPANGAEKTSACDRSTPIPAFATKSDKRVVEVDFNDAKNLASDFDVTFLTRTTGASFMHDQAKSPVAELKGSGAAQTIHVKGQSDDADCELTVPVVTCPTK